MPIKQFDYLNYYCHGEDEKCNAIPAISPLKKGRLLIAAYYQYKYATQIEYYYDPIDASYPDIDTFSANIASYIKNARRHVGDYRHAFLLGMNRDHEILVIYLRENTKEGLLYADSTRCKGKLAAIMQRESNIPVYMLEQTRIEDNYSCYSDGLVIAKDATAKDQNGFLIPNLLEQLQARSAFKTHYYTTLLPDALLKTAQNQRFINTHMISSATIIKNNKTLHDYHKHLRLAIPTYLHQKSNYFADIIEIQFYITQMEKVANGLLPKELRDAYLNQSKILLKTQGHHFADRAGLYQFTQDFFTEHRNAFISTHPASRPMFVNELYQSLCSAKEADDALNKIKHYRELLSEQECLQLVDLLTTNMNKHQLAMETHFYFFKSYSKDSKKMRLALDLLHRPPLSLIGIGVAENMGDAKHLESIYLDKHITT